MRDIVISTKAQPTSNKLSGTLTRGEYKSYRDFLESYGGDSKNSKDDQESVSSTDSGISESKSDNASNSSLNLGETNGTNSKSFNTRTGSFRNYLESYNHKKFSSVKPKITGKNVKSEIVIQVNAQSDDDVDCSANQPPSVPLPPPPPPNIDEKQSAVTQCEKPPTPKIEDKPPVNFKSKKQPSNKETKQNNFYNVIEQIQKRNGHQSPAPEVPPPKNSELKNTEPKTPEAKETPQSNGCSLPPPPPPPPMFPSNSSCSEPKKWAQIKTEETTTHKSSENQPQNVAATNLAKILKEHLLLNRSPMDSEPKVEKAITSPPIASKPPQFLKARTKSPDEQSNGKFSNGVDFSTTTIVPVAESDGRVTKNDPNVRKLVYNTYRGLLGAYNNKANDMVATLPRTMVRKDRGVTQQLESIASMGGLEKLNGRTNPKVEQE